MLPTVRYTGVLMFILCGNVVIDLSVCVYVFVYSEEERKKEREREREGGRDRGEHGSDDAGDACGQLEVGICRALINECRKQAALPPVACIHQFQSLYSE